MNGERSRAMGLKILKPGLLTTVQDMGRWGYQKEGVIVSGAMDLFAHRVANLLVGNKEEASTLELTLVGPQICFEQDLLIALTGADLSPRVNGKAVPLWRPVFVRAGSELSFGAPVAGCRAYLGVAGSFAIPSVMASCATYLRAGIGGLHGKALQAGDLIPVHAASPWAMALMQFPQPYNDDIQDKPASWSLHPELYDIYAVPEIRAIKGPEHELFSSESKEAFWQTPYQVSTHSDRMGYRLEGRTLQLLQNVEMLSSAVTFGTVQVPAEGNPIVLMADHQTTGGYPRIAQVISADLPRLAQLTPGNSLTFKEVTLQEAQRLYFAQEQKIGLIRRALQLKTSLSA